MKKTKFAYLFATALVAGTMGLTSCQEEVENPAATGESTVTIGLSTIGTRSSANEVNMGSELQKISNVVVVPMIQNAYQNPILFGDFTPKATGKLTKKATTLSQSVSRFKVFGNVPASCFGSLSETSVFTSAAIKAEAAVDAPTPGTYSQPHGLYYYYDTESNGFSASAQEWPSTGEPTDWQTVTALGANKSVKITPVNYAVGVLAAAVLNGDAAEVFKEGEVMKSFDNCTTNPVTVSGLIVYGQTESFDADFKASGSVNVYETANVSAIGDATVDNDNRGNGNIYCVVAPTTADRVSLNIEFEVAAGYSLTLANGDEVAAGDKFYLPVVLNKALATSGSGNVFEADKATFLNATVKNWGLASETPVQTTDVTVGVEFDVTWGAGLVFNVEI